MFDFLGSILSGGATGLLGVVANGIFGWLKERGEREERLEMRRLSIQHAQLEFESRERIVDREQDARELVSSDELRRSSYSQDKATYSRGIQLTTSQGWLMVLVDFLRGMIRPVTTVYLIALVTAIYITTHIFLKGLAVAQHINTANMLEQQREIISTVLYLCTVCVTWWFGDRAQRRLRND